MKYSATSPNGGTETFAYNTFGGSSSLESAGGTRLTQNHVKTGGQFFQAATAIAGGVAAAYTSNSNNALSAAQSANATSVTNTAAQEATKQTAIKATPILVPEGQTIAFPPQ